MHLGIRQKMYEETINKWEVAKAKWHIPSYKNLQWLSS